MRWRCSQQLSSSRRESGGEMKRQGEAQSRDDAMITRAVSGEGIRSVLWGSLCWMAQWSWRVWQESRQRKTSQQRMTPRSLDVSHGQDLGFDVPTKEKKNHKTYSGPTQWGYDGTLLLSCPSWSKQNQLCPDLRRLKERKRTTGGHLNQSPSPARLFRVASVQRRSIQTLLKGFFFFPGHLTTEITCCQDGISVGEKRIFLKTLTVQLVGKNQRWKGP